jgi:hypothetical protein
MEGRPSTGSRILCGFGQGRADRAGAQKVRVPLVGGSVCSSMKGDDEIALSTPAHPLPGPASLRPTSIPFPSLPCLPNCDSLFIPPNLPPASLFDFCSHTPIAPAAPSSFPASLLPTLGFSFLPARPT